MSNKDVIGQSVMQHESLFKVSKLLDQFKDGLKSVNVLSLIQSFPQPILQCFTFTGEVSIDDVLDALYVDDNDELTDATTLAYLHSYIRSLLAKGRFIYLQHANSYIYYDLVLCVTRSYIYTGVCDFLKFV